MPPRISSDVVAGTDGPAHRAVFSVTASLSSFVPHPIIPLVLRTLLYTLYHDSLSSSVVGHYALRTLPPPLYPTSPTKLISLDLSLHTSTSSPHHVSSTLLLDLLFPRFPHPIPYHSIVLPSTPSAPSNLLTTSPRHHHILPLRFRSRLPTPCCNT